MATKKSIEVNVITSSHWITGMIYPEARGLFSHMNMPTESAIEIEAGEVTTLFKRSQSAESFGRMWLVKREIVAILVGNRAGLGPSNVLQAGCMMQGFNPSCSRKRRRMPRLSSLIEREFRGSRLFRASRRYKPPF